MNLHTYVFFVYDFMYHLKQHNSWGRTKMERKEGRKTRAQVIKCILCNVFFTFEIDTAGKYLCRFSIQPCYLCKYSNRSRTILYMTV